MISTQFQKSQREEYANTLSKVARFNYEQPLPAQPVTGDGTPTIGRLSGEITDTALEAAGSSLIEFTALCHSVGKTPQAAESDLAKYGLWYQSTERLKSSSRLTEEAAESMRSIRPQKAESDKLVEQRNELQKRIDVLQSDITEVSMFATNKRVEAAKDHSDAFKMRKSIARETGNQQYVLSLKINNIRDELADVNKQFAGKTEQDELNSTMVQKNIGWVERRLQECKFNLGRLKKPNRRDSKYFGFRNEAETILKGFTKLKIQRNELIEQLRNLDSQRNEIATEWEDQLVVDFFQDVQADKAPEILDIPHYLMPNLSKTTTVSLKE